MKNTIIKLIINKKITLKRCLIDELDLSYLRNNIFAQNIIILKKWFTYYIILIENYSIVKILNILKNIYLLNIRRKK